MLRVLLPPAQPGRRQFQYSLPALFDNAAADDSLGAAVCSTLTIGGHQDNTVWVRPQRVAARHAQLRLKLSQEVATGGGSTASPSPQMVKLQVRCHSAASVSGSNSSLISWDTARSGMWRQLPLNKWCTLHEGDIVLLGAGWRDVAEAQQGSDSLAGCCLLQVAGLCELRKWALQQTRRRKQPQAQQKPPGIAAPHDAFPPPMAAARAQQTQPGAAVDALAQQQQLAQSQRQRPRQHDQPAEQQQQQQQPPSPSQQRHWQGSDPNPSAAKRQRRGEGKQLLEPLAQQHRPRAVPTQPTQQQYQGQRRQQVAGHHEGRPATSVGRPFGLPPSPKRHALAQQQQQHAQPQALSRRQQAVASSQQQQQRCIAQPERSAGSSPAGPEARQQRASATTPQRALAKQERQLPATTAAEGLNSNRTAAAAAARQAPTTTRPAAVARNAGATASMGAAPRVSEPAAQQQQLQQGPAQVQPAQLEEVQDVKAELKRLGKRYTGSDPTQGIRLRVKQDTLERLRRIAQQAHDLPCFATVKPQWGLRRLLSEGFRPAQLCKRSGPAALVGEALTLRTTCRLKKDDACGWLSGVLTEAGSRQSSSFTSNEYFIPRKHLDELARQFGAEYDGEDLMLEMNWETNEFGFLQDTLFREEEDGGSSVNVKPFVALLHSTAEGVAVPLPVVYATRPIRAGEELVADGMDELDAQDLLLDGLASRLIASGWRCHLLDAIWLRLAKLAQQHCRQLAASNSTTGAAHRLRLVLKGALRLYYGQQTCGREAGGGAISPGYGSSGGGGYMPPDMLQRLDVALAASSRAHRPPSSAKSLSCREAPSHDQQFRQLARRELPPLCRGSNFSSLPEDVLRVLDAASDGRPLEEAVRLRLRRGDVPSAVVCEIRYRLHRVRLLTPPGCPAYSLNAAPDAAPLAAGDCVGVYVGRVVTADVAEEESHESAYLYDIKARQVGPDFIRGKAWAYDGPDLLVDASQLRNELAFANDVFGAAPSTRPSLYTQVIWDPETKRPALKMSYLPSGRAKLLQELLLSYGDSYWPVEGPKLRRKHEAYAVCAAQAIAAVHAALSTAGAPPAALEACLAPVDLASAEHRFYEAFILE